MVGLESRRRSRCRQPGSMMSFIIPWREARRPRLTIMKEKYPHYAAFKCLDQFTVINVYRSLQRGQISGLSVSNAERLCSMFRQENCDTCTRKPELKIGDCFAKYDTLEN
ncbi:hypothetical protein AVEN_243546-1 [Araneus ventricosus]|uniref:Uncharacterized protein n=1 Tax=Araneus ventricosus TaxID=182803 RepID=A0A4Y2R9A9_ARAVE|nr:hypothetical protein AVEN_243546-1 [Araneus ventricosus]